MYYRNLFRAAMPGLFSRLQAAAKEGGNLAVEIAHADNEVAREVFKKRGPIYQTVRVHTVIGSDFIDPRFNPCEILAKQQMFFNGHQRPSMEAYDRMLLDMVDSEFLLKKFAKSYRKAVQQTIRLHERLKGAATFFGPIWNA